MKRKSFIARLRADERGATAVELGMICAMIVLVMLTALRGFAGGSVSMWNKVQTESANAVAATGA